MTHDRWQFHHAAKHNQLDTLKHATRRECDRPDEDGRTPVHWAAFYGHLDSLRLLMTKGGDPDLQDVWGNSPLHCCAALGHMHCVSYLVNFGANLWALDNDKQSALQLAELANHPEIVTFLDECMDKQLRKDPKLVAKLKTNATKKADKHRRACEAVMKRRAGSATPTGLLPSTELAQSNHVINNNGSTEAYLVTGLMNPLARSKNGTASSEPEKSFTEHITYLESDTVRGASYGDSLPPPHSNHSAYPVRANLSVSNNTSVSGVSKKVERHKKKHHKEEVTGPVVVDTGGGMRSARSLNSIMNASADEIETLRAARHQQSLRRSIVDRQWEGSSLHDLSTYQQPQSMETLRTGGTVNSMWNRPAASVTLSPMRPPHPTHNNHVDRSNPQPDQQIMPWSENELRCWMEEYQQPQAQRRANPSDPNSGLGFHADQLFAFLAAYGLSDLWDLLSKEKLDVDALQLCTEDDFIHLNLPLGSRRKLSHALEQRAQNMRAEMFESTAL